MGAHALRLIYGGVFDEFPGQGARYKLPEDLLVVDELPRTKVGKIDKKRLRDVVRDRAGSVEAV